MLGAAPFVNVSPQIASYLTSPPVVDVDVDVDVDVLFKRLPRSARGAIPVGRSMAPARLDNVHDHDHVHVRDGRGCRSGRQLAGLTGTVHVNLGFAKGGTRASISRARMHASAG
jgi:hypothetical protein